jgi:hypothetical protein
MINRGKHYGCIKRIVFGLLALWIVVIALGYFLVY